MSRKEANKLALHNEEKDERPDDDGFAEVEVFLLRVIDFRVVPWGIPRALINTSFFITLSHVEHNANPQGVDNFTRLPEPSFLRLA